MTAPGVLIYVMGPSGSGKDTVLTASRPKLSGIDVRFARRTITRPPGTGEDNLELSPAAFAQRVTDGGFALWWEAHGNHYGIDAEIDGWLADGAIVVVSGSRAHLATAAERYGRRLRPVVITADRDVLARRLAGRGRESANAQAARLERSVGLDAVEHPRLTVIDNGGPVEMAVAAFVELVHAARPG